MEELLGRPQHYQWGSPTAIPHLLGEEPDGRPWAEVWYGAHPSAPSLVGGERLDALLAANPAQLGRAAQAQFGSRLPFLLKLLAARQSLSLQAHPSRESAAAGFAREEAAGLPIDAPERLYVDDWPKPELICALDEFHALCGFRDPNHTLRLFEQFGCEHALCLLEPLRSQPPAAALRVVFGTFLADDGALVADILTTAQTITSDGEVGEFAATALELAADYPGDPGIAAALLLNRITLQPGEAIYLPAAILHGYLRGFGVELMANSNNVLRGGLTPKHVAVTELHAQLDFRPYRPEIISGTPTDDGVWTYPTPAPEFALWRLAGDTHVPATQLGRILLVTAGAVVVNGQGKTLDLHPGEAAWLRAGEETTISGKGTCWLAATGS